MDFKNYIFDEKDWGPWICAAEHPPLKVGDIIVLGLYGPDIEGQEASIYMISGPNNIYGDTPLHCWSFSRNVWDDGHCWQMKGQTSYRRYLKQLQSSSSKYENRECPCGIYSGDCDYHR